MKVELFAHSRLPANSELNQIKEEYGVTDGQVIALAAIRQCYSYLTAREVLEVESKKYFGEKGVEGKRLFNYIIKSGHTSTLEHINLTFTVEHVSRALLAQLTRHRLFSFSVQSQRYVKFSSDSRSGGFEYVVPETILWESPAFKTYDEAKKIKERNRMIDVNNEFEATMELIQAAYDRLIELGIPQEDARTVLPNAAATNLVTTVNLRALVDFYAKRRPGNGAQHEIAQFAERLRALTVAVEPWTDEYFDLACK